MIEEAFEVATEFKFDVGQAVFNTDSLKASVDSLSKTADNALGSLNYLAGGLVAHLGLGSGGLLSILSESVQLADQFHTGSMGFINSIGSNMNVLSGHVHGFNEQLESSAMLMSKVGEMASKFGLNTNQLASMTQLLATPLAQRGKLGTNYGNGIELAKNAMIVGESTGLGNGAVSESLLRGLSPGGAVMGKLFERLVNTQAFRGAGVIHPAQMANMLPDRKIDLLTKAMGELGNNAGYLNERLNSISVAFTMIKNRLSDVLTPIGQALREPLLLVMKQIGDFLGQHGKALGTTIANIIRDIFKDPKALLINLMQLKEVGNDFKGALKFTELFLTLRFLKTILSWLGVEFNGGLIMMGLRSLISGFRWLAALVPWGAVFSFLFRMIMTVFVEFIPILTAAFVLLQGLSRASAQAKVSDAGDMLANSERIGNAMFQWKRLASALWSPLQELIQVIADLFEPLFKWSNYVLILVWATEKMEPLFEFIIDGFLGVAAAIHAMVAAIKEEIHVLYTDIATGNIAKLGKDLIGMDGGHLDQTYTRSFDDYIDKNYNRLGKPDDSASKISITNNNNINATFNLKEQLEPDRVAFAVTTHLKKLVMDRTQGQSQSIHSGLAGKNGTVF